MGESISNEVNTRNFEISFIYATLDLHTKTIISNVFNYNYT